MPSITVMLYQSKQAFLQTCEALARPGRGVLLAALLGLALGLASVQVQAGTIVRFSTAVGDFSVELLDDTAPVTVQNFLNYVNRGDYDGTYLHRVVDDFVVQGGAFRFQPFVGAIAVPTDPPIVNEFNVSNTRGTLAMAKLDGDPNSATNQWFVNLVDNTNLDTTNGGFTVFGNVLEPGMVVLDEIDALPTVNLGSRAPSTPFFTEFYNNNPENFVFISALVTGRYSGAAHVYETQTGKLITSVNVDDGSTLLAMNMDTVSTTGGVTLRINPLSVIRRRDNVEGIATFSTTDNRLRIPSLEVFDGQQVLIARNVVFLLTNAETGEFVLESFEQ